MYRSFYRSLALLIAGLIVVSCSSGQRQNNNIATTAEVESQVQTGIDIGQRAPELVFESPDGEKIALSSLRGKIVLIDFWAAWCTPCRAENPNLVRIYKEYRDKQFENGDGFTIYSVSLDRSKDDWVGAIEKDGLEWKYHVSDLKWWQSVPAAMYGVMGIPMNFLIDGDGIIVAKGLRGQYLENKMKELLR